MKITWRDGAGTLLVAGAVTLAAASLQGFDWFLLGSWRSSTLAVLLLGIASCVVVNPNSPPEKNSWIKTASYIGGFSGIMALLALLFNLKLAFVAFVASIVVLWVLTTIHHMVESNHTILAGGRKLRVH